MTDKKIIKAINILLKDFGDYKPCKGWDPDCANCKLYVLSGYLFWLRDLLSPHPDKKNK